MPRLYSYRKVQVGKDQEKAQSEKDSHSKTRGGKKQSNNQVLIPYISARQQECVTISKFMFCYMCYESCYITQISCLSFSYLFLHSFLFN